ncbi:hypothetical protein M422DRAFT_268762 [Sphaerobolus stellatus SS14]|uniref:Uncharacterized protein n=1 Tax=Sphaerobolus stellatus (strain SS14) TaxID=990650 RepID=A0A0C9ULU3_SPHS4|nr:hypothetical protein M422DRAFT_268762 [Sphaerobolus stellatus SS14]
MAQEVFFSVLKPGILSSASHVIEPSFAPSTTTTTPKDDRSKRSWNGLLAFILSSSESYILGNNEPQEEVHQSAEERDFTPPNPTGHKKFQMSIPSWDLPSLLASTVHSRMLNKRTRYTLFWITRRHVQHQVTGPGAHLLSLYKSILDHRPVISTSVYITSGSAVGQPNILCYLKLSRVETTPAFNVAFANRFLQILLLDHPIYCNPRKPRQTTASAMQSAGHEDQPGMFHAAFSLRIRRRSTGRSGTIFPSTSSYIRRMQRNERGQKKRISGGRRVKLSVVGSNSDIGMRMSSGLRWRRLHRDVDDNDESLGELDMKMKHPMQSQKPK